LSSRSSFPWSSRWWFLPGGAQLDDDRFIDLSEVQPQLHVIGQIGMHDAPAGSISSNDRQIRDDVNARFDAYAAKIPEWRELAEVFRAYVLAQWLHAHAPALAAQLLRELPEPRPPITALPDLYDPLIAVVSREPDVTSTGIMTFHFGVGQGGVGFSRGEIRRAAPSASSDALRRATTGTATASLASVRLFVPDRKGLMPGAGALRSMPRVVETELRARYERAHRLLPVREGGLLRRIHDVIGGVELFVLTMLCAGIAAFLGTWKVELRLPS